ncbi:MAG: hypothetical protein RLY50_112 [Actinomycetota bacterium]
MSVVIAAGLTLVVVGMSVATTGREAQRLPDAIEQISPGPGDTVLVQSQVFVDFIPGYAATLIIDGIELETTRLDQLSAGGQTPRPGAQVEIPPTAIYDPGNFTISYLPQEGGAIESFAQGPHRATVRYWKIEDGPTKERSFSWEFTTN